MLLDALTEGQEEGEEHNGSPKGDPFAQVPSELEALGGG